jgi:hypothetical protein
MFFLATADAQGQPDCSSPVPGWKRWDALQNVLPPPD